MKMIKLTTASLALIAIASYMPSAKAGSLGAADGDLILGVYDTSGTDTNSLEVNLGLETGLTNGETFALGSDLTAAGLTDSSLVFDVAATGGLNGANGLVADEIQLTSTGTFNSPVSNTSTEAGNINAETVNGHGSSFPSAGSSPTAVYVADSNSSSFKTTVTNSGGSYGLGSSAPSGVTGALTSGTVLDLYDLTGVANGGTGIPTELGTFTVLSNGTSVEFNAVASPEPSTYALMGLGGLAFLWVLKRRKSVA